MDNKLTINKYKSDCLAIVESVLTEEPIDEEEFLKKCSFIDRNYYNDIVTERSLTDLCGYALCTNKLSVHSLKLKPSQRYKISLNSNRVYEITERKMFCSNLCFKSSNYLREQISEEPLWMRNKSSTGRNCIHLYNQQVGQLGHEVVFDEDVIKESNIESINNNTNEKQAFKQKSILTNRTNDKKLINNKNSVGFPYIKEEYLNELKTQLNNLTINEKIDDRINHMEADDKNYSPESSIPLTEPKNKDKLLKTTISPKSTLESIETTLKEWITSSTHEFVFGVKANQRNDQQNNQQISENIEELHELEDEDNEKKLEQMRYNYMMLCAKLDLEEKRDQLIDDILLGRVKNGKSAKDYESEDYINLNSNNDFSKKFESFRKGKLISFRNRKVRFNEEVKSENSEQDHSDHFIPLIDSLDVSRKRQNILLSDIDKVMVDLFDFKYLEELRINIKDLISTFKLTANNVVLHTKESVLMCLFLTRMLILAKKVQQLDDLFENERILSVLTSFNLNKLDVDNKIMSYFSRD